MVEDEGDGDGEGDGDDDGAGVAKGILVVEMRGIDVVVSETEVVGVAVSVVVTNSVVGSMSMTDIVRVAGLPETVTVSVTGGGDSMMVVGADVTVTVRVVSASPPCPPLPSIGTTEYVGRAAVTSVAGALFHRNGNADDRLQKAVTATKRETGRVLRYILLG